MNDAVKMIPLETALHIVDNTLADVKVHGETIPIRDAVGRVLLSDQTSQVDLPPFDKSAMDGYAVLADDERNEYRLLETVAAGEVGTKRLEPGTTVKVMTGAAVPPGTGRVIIIEHTEQHGDTVRVLKQGGGTNICWQGEDVRRADAVLSAGTVLSTVDSANLIGCGLADVEVARQPRIAIISTGNEIVDSPALLEFGKIINVNGPLLAGLAAHYGLVVVSEQCVPDDREAIAQALHAALDQADIVVVSGGVSAGDFDFVIEVLADVGLKLHFSRVAVKPGKPMTYASAPGKVVFGLPGNPVSVYLTFHLFVLRAVALMTGAEPQMREFTLPLASDFQRRKAERLEYVPCKLTSDGAVKLVEYHGSAHLHALTHADGFFIVPVGVTELHVGNEVTFTPLTRCYQ